MPTDLLMDELARQLDGDLRQDDVSRRVYAVDASIYRIMPRAVALPRHVDDLRTIAAFCAAHAIPMVPRGAATGTTGGCIGPGLVVDTSRYLTRILSLDPEARLAVCEPGVVQDQLNAAARPHGLRFGPDTSTGNRATLGGMLGNNASGAHSLRYGKTVDNLHALDIVLPGGSVLSCADHDAAAWAAACAADDFAAPLYRTVERIRTDLRDEIAARYPAIQRRVSGYNLDAFITPGPWNLAQLICGSEGTLGLCSQLTVKLADSPAHTGIVVLQFYDLISALEATAFCLQYQPFSLEMIDDQVIASGRLNPSMQGQTGWVQGEPGGVLVAEFDADSAAALDARLDTFRAAADRQGLGYHRQVIREPAVIDQVWRLRKAGLGLLMGRRTHDRAIAFLEDVAVPPAKLAAFMTAFRGLIRGAGKEAGFYGHAGVGCIHVRPMLDLRQEADAALMVRLMEQVADLVGQYGGAISGEHGDGLIRSWLNERYFGPQLYAAFRDIKRAFDPQNLLNPGKIVDAQGPLENLRVGPKTPTAAIRTRLDFSREGGFGFAINMCNANGQCRKLSPGTMCPSYQAAGDEYYSTRARAQALQGVINGDLPLATFTDSPDLHAVLDACLQCKGCQRECPSGVDMAKLKSEYLYQHQRRHGIPLRSRLFGNLNQSAALASLAPGLANAVLRSDLARRILGRLGIDPRRRLPAYARRTFTAWALEQRLPAPDAPSARVVVFADTFTQHHFPEIGSAAVRVLGALGCQIRTLPYRCCGRPLITKGLLDHAAARARALVSLLEPAARDGWRIVGLEPSCILSLRDEYPALVPGAAADTVADACITFPELVTELLDSGVPNPFQPMERPVWVQAHCHQAAIVGVGPSLRALGAVPGVEAHAFEAGCCGMAGSFGYEKEHFDFSMKVGETRLFPAIRDLTPGTWIVADGISCRHQIRDGVDRGSRHLAQVLAKALPLSPEFPR